MFCFVFIRKIVFARARVDTFFNFYVVLRTEMTLQNLYFCFVLLILLCCRSFVTSNAPYPYTSKCCAMTPRICMQPTVLVSKASVCGSPLDEMVDREMEGGAGRVDGWIASRPAFHLFL